MNKLLPTFVIAALGAVVYLPAQAQDASTAGDNQIATLQIRQGTIMHSTGGEFTNASNGERLMDGERIMVSEGSKAVVVYDDKCRHEYVDPGVYQVDNKGCGAGYVASSTVATEVAVAAVLAPLLIDTDRPKNPPPPAPVSR